MTVVSGLRNQAAEGAGVHTVNPGTWLVVHVAVLAEDRRAAARHVGRPDRGARASAQDTPFPSLELCTEVKPGSGAACSADFGCGLGSTISFRTATPAAADGAQPAQGVLPLVRPGRHGGRARGDHRADGQPARPRERTKRRRCAASSAPPTRRAWTTISTPCARSSAKRRTWPIRISRGSTCPMRRPACRPTSTSTSICMFDLAALAYQAGLTRVVSFMMAAEISMLTYNQVGVSEAFHPLSHHQNNAGQDGAARRRADVSLEGVRAVPRQAQEHAGRRRLAARPLDPAVRQQHERLEPAQRGSAAVRGVRPRLRRASRAAST